MAMSPEDAGDRGDRHARRGGCLSPCRRAHGEGVPVRRRGWRGGACASPRTARGGSSTTAMDVYWHPPSLCTHSLVRARAASRRPAALITRASWRARGRWCVCRGSRWAASSSGPGGVPPRSTGHAPALSSVEMIFIVLSVVVRAPQFRHAAPHTTPSPIRFKPLRLISTPHLPPSHLQTPPPTSRPARLFPVLYLNRPPASLRPAASESGIAPCPFRVGLHPSCLGRTPVEPAPPARLTHMRVGLAVTLGDAHQRRRASLPPGVSASPPRVTARRSVSRSTSTSAAPQAHQPLHKRISRSTSTSAAPQARQPRGRAGASPRGRVGVERDDLAPVGPAHRPPPAPPQPAAPHKLLSPRPAAADSFKAPAPETPPLLPRPAALTSRDRVTTDGRPPLLPRPAAAHRAPIARPCNRQAPRPAAPTRRVRSASKGNSRLLIYRA